MTDRSKKEIKITEKMNVYCNSNCPFNTKDLHKSKKVIFLVVVLSEKLKRKTFKGKVKRQREKKRNMNHCY